MAADSELDTIRSNPIKGGLDAFRSLFVLTRADLGLISGDVQDVFSTATTAVIKSLVLDLVLALQNQSAARILHSRIGDRSLAGDLGILYGRVDSNQLDIAIAIPLVQQVIANKPGTPSWNDTDVWDAVYRLVARANPATPPTALKNTTFNTPLRPNSASQSGTEQTHDEVDQRILEELTGRVYYDVRGFYERYFEGKSWEKKAIDIYEEATAQCTQGCWNGWPEPPIQDQFFEWFMSVQATVLTGLPHRYYTSAHKVVKGSDADRSLDIFLASTNALLVDEHDWSNVLVIGEHKSNPNEDCTLKTLVQLAGYAREVFGSQPDRRFVPGFTICGSVMRLWIFDRSSPYCSEKFDIHKEPERFVRVIAGYALMTDAELGLNTFIKRDGDGKYIVTRGVKIYLEDKPIASTKAIVCRGTTCYRGKRSDSTEWEYVVKFAWPSDKRQREGRLLRLAKDRGVTGIAVWFNDEQISIDGNPDTIANLRRDMDFGVPRRLSSKALWVESGMASNRTNSKSKRSLRGRSMSSASLQKGLGISTDGTTLSSSAQKREREDGGKIGNGALKISKSAGGQRDMANMDVEGEPDIDDIHSIAEAEADSLTGFESETYGNRVHCCLVSSPAGWPLHDYRSVRELLEALRDAIKGHRSLLEDGKILHRDISENNIIITKSPAEGELRGRLIDLDLAKELDSIPSGASHRTGTMQFMAIEVLQGNGHTYRHDLESFFYVFLWMCIRYGYEDPSDGASRTASSEPMANKMRVRRRITIRLRGWYTGTYAEIGRNKLGDMDKNGFEGIIAEFAPKFERLKTLARELRKVLFPIKDGAIFTGTFRDHKIMYDGVINAFDTAIALPDRVRMTSPYP